MAVSREPTLRPAVAKRHRVQVGEQRLNPYVKANR